MSSPVPSSIVQVPWAPVRSAICSREPVSGSPSPCYLTGDGRSWSPGAYRLKVLPARAASRVVVSGR